MAELKIVCQTSKEHKRFFTTAAEIHDWEVDETGEFIKDLGCSEMVSRPDENSSFSCKTCGAKPTVESE